MKYFCGSVFFSILRYGMSLLYGIAGSTTLVKVAQRGPQSRVLHRSQRPRARVKTNVVVGMIALAAAFFQNCSRAIPWGA